MGRFDRYVLSHLLRVFGFFALVLVGVYWVNRAVLLVEEYMAEGQSGGLLLQLTLLSLPSIMVIVLPIAAFVASAYATNRLAADSEIAVVRATGFSAWRVARPFLVFGLLVAALLGVLAHLLVPASMAELNEREAELAQALSARVLTPGTFQSPARGVTVYVREVTAEGRLKGLLVMDRRNPDRETTYSAADAVLVRDPEGTKLVMFDGLAQTVQQPGRRLSTTGFSDFTIDIGGLIQPRERTRRDYRELPTATLLAPTPELAEETRRDPAELMREGHERFTLPLLSIGAALIGHAALMVGGFSRFGLWRQIVLAVFLIVLVKLVDNAALEFAGRAPGNVPAVYAASLLAALVCAGLLALADAGPRRRRQPA